MQFFKNLIDLFQKSANNAVSSFRTVGKIHLESMETSDVFEIAKECKVIDRVFLERQIVSLVKLAIEKNVDIDLQKFDDECIAAFKITKDFIKIVKASGNNNLDIDATLSSIVLKKDDDLEKLFEKFNSLISQFDRAENKKIFNDVIDKIIAAKFEEKQLSWGDACDEDDVEEPVAAVPAAKPVAQTIPTALPSGFTRVDYTTVAKRADNIEQKKDDFKTVVAQPKKKIVKYEWLETIQEFDPSPKKTATSAVRLVTPSAVIPGFNAQNDYFSHVVFDVCSLLDGVNEAPFPVGWMYIGETCGDNDVRYWACRPSEKYKYVFQLDRMTGEWTVFSLPSADIDITTTPTGSIVVQKGMRALSASEFVAAMRKPRA